MDRGGSGKNTNVKKSLGTSEDPGVKELVPEEDRNPIEDITKISPGDELLKRLEKEKKEEKVESSGYAPTRIIDGVEVVDVKAIPTAETKLAVPESERRKTWDKP